MQQSVILVIIQELGEGTHHLIESWAVIVVRTSFVEQLCLPIPAVPRLPVHIPMLRQAALQFKDANKL